MDIESLTATPCTRYILENLERAPLAEDFSDRFLQWEISQLGAVLDYGLLVFTYSAIQSVLFS